MIRKLLVIAGLIISCGAQASIISVTGQATYNGSAAGVDLGGNQATGSTILGYDERQGVAIAANTVEVDYLFGTNLTIGTGVNGISNANSSETLGSGTYDSHILHLDASGPSVSITSATFEFDGSIVALIVSNFGSAGKLLNLSDDDFGNAVNYVGGKSRRLENDDGPLEILAAGNKLQLNGISTFGPIDEVRVITTATPVPTPAPLLMFAAGLVGISLSKRRRQA